MQHPNIDLVQGLYAAYMRGERDTVAQALAPDVRWHQSGFDAIAGTYEGREAVLEHLMGGSHVEDYGMTVTDVLASDTRVAVVATTTGRLGDVPVRNDFVQVIRIDDGHIVEVHTFNWDQQALAELMPAGVHAHA